jgi:hypothetical protein
VTALDFHRIVLGVLLLWGALSLTPLFNSSGALRILTVDRVTLSVRACIVARVLGAANAYGAFHIFWSGS